MAIYQQKDISNIFPKIVFFKCLTIYLFLALFEKNTTSFTNVRVVVLPHFHSRLWLTCCSSQCLIDHKYNQ